MKSTVKLMVLGVALSLTGCGQLLGPLSRAGIAKRLQESTVLVKTIHRDKSGHGTAFFVRGKSGVCTLVTAAHVVLHNGREKEVVRLQTGDGREREPLQILPFERDLDLAAVTFAPREGDRCPYRPLELGNSETVDELDEIYISGFPGRSGGEPVRQTIPTTVTGLGNLPQGYSISYKGELYGGMSGGPVLDRKGRVIAVHGLSDRRLVEIYDAQRQASLLPQELAAVRQAEERVRSGVVAVNTFKWGIPINLYVRYRPAMVVPDGAGISSTFAWLLFGGGAVAGGLFVYFGVQPLTGSGGRQYATGFVCAFLVAVAAGALLLVYFPKQPRASTPSFEEATSTPTPKAAAPREEVELKSAKGVDYEKLRDLLAAKDWKKADGETWRVMLRAAGREKDGWLPVENIDNFPCEDLRTIDQLWLKYSDGRFGFSVQKDIYQELDGFVDWKALGDQVGWREGGSWLSYDELNWAVASSVSPPGHLPLAGWLRGASPSVQWIYHPSHSYFAQRLVTCSL